jgi:hypothetical protein
VAEEIQYNLDGVNTTYCFNFRAKELRSIRLFVLKILHVPLVGESGILSLPQLQKYSTCRCIHDRHMITHSLVGESDILSLPQLQKHSTFRQNT